MLRNRPFRFLALLFLVVATVTLASVTSGRPLASADAHPVALTSPASSAGSAAGAAPVGASAVISADVASAAAEARAWFADDAARQARHAWATDSGYLVHSGPNTTSRVVLSFDDCPTNLGAFKSMVLAAQQMGIAMVLFPTGECVESGRFDPAFARAHGHYVFNHSVSHPQLATLSYARITAELGSPGIQTTYARPPFGNLSTVAREAYADKGMRLWLWTLDTNDWRGPKKAPEIVNYISANAKAGDTILMHMEHAAFFPSVLAQVKAVLTARGLGICRNQGATEVAPKTVNC